MPHQTHTSPAMTECIQQCLACYTTCQQTALTHCLELGGEHVEPTHFRLMIDCAEVCRSAAALMANGSAFHAAQCVVCADICRACAESCKRVGDMDECVQACERCADACEAMASGGGRSATGHAAGTSARAS
ncbi:MAG: hypothetical protein BGP24_09665 [Lysobacterales bacterium 69-70]|nr:four-helix bundle copper-binding protein [Xanthomonadaceae bacterium]ODU33222.1 MAG: hypothetical protein ABS97_12690 [Xanthomonadaceae bacterium SCN 69-320]ODV20452.1 MAG: hypothetical protein ABT27_06980 [Xanthomonadaceae bacterium SCN 69-25]OJZ00766.1 MAG: hypothetical protein BGP24_09665 [Xanthomonadales bacterium 69-70]